MKPIYQKIWQQALPYYQKGRAMDIGHIKWMMQDALLICEKEDLDDSLLLPLVILHDVGYSQIKSQDYYNLDIRRAHMKVGAKIAKEILEKIGYPKEKIKKITYYVSVHDNWALDKNEVYDNDIILATFQDLDFMWTATPQGFSDVMKIRKTNKKEMLNYIENNDKHKRRPIATKTARELYKKYLKNQKDI